MINKKGFTLVELIATIGILVLMSLIIGVNISSLLKSTEQNQKLNDKRSIQDAACVYVDSSLCEACNDQVTVNKLVEVGLLDKSFKDKSGTITVTRTNGEKKCEYNE